LKVLFINPSVRYYDEARHVPLGILQLMAILERDHPQIKFQLYDQNAFRIDNVLDNSTEGLDEVLKSEDFDVVAIGGLITAFRSIKLSIKKIKQIQPHVKIIAGGGFYSAIPYDIMDMMPELDYGCVGESYVTLPELLHAIDKNEDPSNVKGIFYRKEGMIKFSEPRELIADMDWLPFPAYKYAPLDIYFKNSGIIMSEESLKSKKRLDACMSLSCPFLCRFCWDLGVTSNTKMEVIDGKPEPKTGRPGRASIVRHHSAEYFANYVEHLRKDFTKIPWDEEGNGVGYPVDFIATVDENLVAHDAQTRFTWLNDVKDELWKRDLIADCIKNGVPHDPKTCDGPHYGGTSHAGLINEKTLKTLKDIGVTYLDYGLEHWDNKILRNLGKGATAEANKKAIKLTMDAGISPIPNQIIMFPDESWESLNTMLDAWEDTKIVTSPFICTPYPGAEWYIKYKDFILEQYDGSLEAFIEDLEDATKVTALLTKKFTPAEAVGIQSIMTEAAITGDFKNARRLLANSKRMKEKASLVEKSEDIVS
jgi:anaerobic magnesium-protoporphyrin IX monomethyl ester cyclase